MKYGYKETRHLSGSDLRSLCVKENRYTLGTNEEYFNLLETAEKTENITTDDLVELATDIKSHSETDAEITSIMFILAKACVSVFDEV